MSLSAAADSCASAKRNKDRLGVVHGKVYGFNLNTVVRFSEGSNKLEERTEIP